MLQGTSSVCVYILATQVATTDSAMAKYFERNGKFAFPNELFPTLNSSDLPEAPEKAANQLSAQFQSVDSKPEGAQLECATRILFHAEIYGTIPTETINKACEMLDSLAETSATASYIVGNWYMYGLFGRTQARSKAKDYYRKSIKLGGTRSWYRLGSSAEEKNDADMAVSRYECGAKLGDAACLYRLAIAILKGHFGYPKDAQKALNLLEKACENADEDFPQPFFLSGMVLLGEVEQGAVAPNRSKGFERIRKAAKLHFAPALIRMAAAHQQNALPYDCAAVMRYLHCAARQERFLAFQKLTPQFAGDAEIQLSKLFLCGAKPIIMPNEEWAYKFAVASVECGNSTAQFAVGYYAEVGVYIRRDLQLATTMYEQASLNNCEAATQRLAKCKKSLTGGVDLKRSATLTRKDHEVALQRTLSQASQNGKNVSMRNIVENLGQQLDESEVTAPHRPQPIKVDLSGPGVPNASRNPFDPVNTPQSDGTPLTSPDSSQPSPIAISCALKPPYPETTTKAPYPSDESVKQLDQPFSTSTKADNSELKLDNERSMPLDVPGTPYPASPEGKPEMLATSEILTGLDRNDKSPYPVSPGAFKSPYPLSPPKPLATLKTRASVYPDDGPKVQKTSVYIPDSPDERYASPGSNQPYSRSTSPFRSISSNFSAPNWVKGHSRSRSASPERTPSPSRRSPLSVMSKLRNRLSMGGSNIPENKFAPVDFDQPAQREEASQDKPIQNTSTFEADSILGDQLANPALITSLNMEAPLAKPAPFDSSLGSILEDGSKLTSMQAPPPPGVGSRSSTPVQRKPIGTPANIPTARSGTPSPERPASPFVNGISPSASSRQVPVAKPSTDSSQHKSTTAMGIKRSSASVRPKGHRYSMSMATPSDSKTDGGKEMQSTSRNVSSPLRTLKDSGSATVNSVALKHHALSFDEMGIKTVVEEKGGPCVIA